MLVVNVEKRSSSSDLVQDLSETTSGEHKVNLSVSYKYER